MRKILARISVAVAILCAVLAAAPSAHADATTDIFSGFQGKSKDPVQVDAASLETYEENKQRVSVFSGGVTVKRGDTLMKANTIKLFSAGSDATNANAFTRIEANGKIYVSSGDQTVTGETAVVDMKANTITIAGGVVLSQGTNVITGSRLIVNMTTGRARVEQEPGKQIRGVFSPGDANLVQKPGQ
jgi:lipopolysaccharide export system protein LptA